MKDQQMPWMLWPRDLIRFLYGKMTVKHLLYIDATCADWTASVHPEHPQVLGRTRPSLGPWNSGERPQLQVIIMLAMVCKPVGLPASGNVHQQVTSLVSHSSWKIILPPVVIIAIYKHFPNIPPLLFRINKTPANLEVFSHVPFPCAISFWLPG